MTENFAELFEESLQTIEMAPGSIVTGTIVEIDNDWVIVHAGLKSEGVIPIDQFADENGETNLTVGDQVKVAMEVVDDGWGGTRLSREKARRAESWMMLDEAFEGGDVVTGIINGRSRADSPSTSTTSGHFSPVRWWTSGRCARPRIWKAHRSNSK